MFTQNLNNNSNVGICRSVISPYPCYLMACVSLLQLRSRWEDVYHVQNAGIHCPHMSSVFGFGFCCCSFRVFLCFWFLFCFAVQGVKYYSVYTLG